MLSLLWNHLIFQDVSWSLVLVVFPELLNFISIFYSFCNKGPFTSKKGRWNKKRYSCKRILFVKVVLTTDYAFCKLRCLHLGFSIFNLIPCLRQKTKAWKRKSQNTFLLILAKLIFLFFILYNYPLLDIKKNKRRIIGKHENIGKLHKKINY
jgi:hypothetical protein